MATLTEVRDRGQELFAELLAAQQPGQPAPIPPDAQRFSWFDARHAVDAGSSSPASCRPRRVCSPRPPSSGSDDDC